MGYLRVRVGFEFVYGTPNNRRTEGFSSCVTSAPTLNPGKKHTYTRHGPSKERTPMEALRYNPKLALTVR